MPRISLLLLVLFSSLYLKAQTTPSFQGKWKIANMPGYHFDVQVRQSGNKISGSYCAYPKDLSRMDCNTEAGGEPCPVFGQLKHDTAYITFVSCYSGDTGKAIIWVQNGILHWKTTFNPYTSASNWNGVPDAAILKSREQHGQTNSHGKRGGK
jgi:hypothetical protein